MRSRKRLWCLLVALTIDCALLAVLSVDYLFLAFAEGMSAAPPSKTRRHVLLLTVDTLRADYLSSSAYDRPTTPFLDSVMAQGFRFTRARTTIPRTTPAVTSLMTGTYPHTSRVRRLTDRLPPRIISVAELARSKGYTTLAVVSNEILQHRGLGAGFDIYDGSDFGLEAAETTDAVLRTLHGFGPDTPLFVWAHYVDPHTPYDPPADLAAQFDPDYQGRYSLSFGIQHLNTHPTDLKKADVIYRNPLPDSVNAHIRRLYAAEIRHTDDQIARLVRGLRSEFGDDWLIVFTADHGEGLGEHNYFYEHGDYVYDDQLRIPLAFVVPKGDPLYGSATIDAPVSLVDVMPTLVDLLDLPQRHLLDYDIDGRALTPYFRGKELSPQPIFAECGQSFYPDLVQRRVRFDVGGRFRAVVLGDWKLIWTPGRVGDDRYELYNLARDPGEKTNVYVSHRDVAAPLEKALTKWLQRGEDNSPGLIQQAAVSPADGEALRVLGYSCN